MKKIIKISAMILAIFLVGCSSDETKDAQQPPIKINMVKAKSVEFSKTLRLYGTFKAIDDVAVGSSLQGMQILSVEVETGERVKEGQILAYLENVGVRSELERAKADLAVQEAALKEASSVFKRHRILFKNGALSKQDFERQEAKVATIQANIKSAKAQIANISHQLNKTELKAPVGGIITKKSGVAGALVSSDALFHIAKDGLLELEVEADANEIALLKPSMRAVIKIPNSQISLDGEIRLVYPELDAATRLGKVRIKINGEWTPSIGSYASAVVNLPTRSVNFALPLSAVSFESGGETKVGVMDEKSRIYKKDVKIGEEQNGLIEIISGVSHNDAVVFQASAFIDEGDVVEPNFIDFKE